MAPLPLDFEISALLWAKRAPGNSFVGGRIPVLPPLSAQRPARFAPRPTNLASLAPPLLVGFHRVTPWLVNVGGIPPVRPA